MTEARQIRRRSANTTGRFADAAAPRTHLPWRCVAILACTTACQSLCAQAAPTVTLQSADILEFPGNTPLTLGPVTAAWAQGDRLTTALQQPLRYSQTGGTLRGQLREVAASRGIAVWLDRRVNPVLPVQQRPNPGPRPPSEILGQLVETAPGTAIFFGDPVVMAGPRQAVFRLRGLTAVHEELLRQNDRGRLRTRIQSLSGSLQWPAATAPAEILSRAAEEAGVRFLAGPEFPHDLWPGRTLPPLSFAELSALVLNQFDLMLTVTPDKQAFTVAPVDLKRQARCRLNLPAELPDGVLADWQKTWPSARLVGRGKSRTVSGNLASLAALEEVISQQLLKPENPPVHPDDNDLQLRRFTLQANVRLGDVVATLRAQGVTVEFPGLLPAELNERLQTPIQVSAVRMDAARFFETVFGEQFSQIEVRRDRVILQP